MEKATHKGGVVLEVKAVTGKSIRPQPRFIFGQLPRTCDTISDFVILMEVANDDFAVLRAVGEVDG